MVKSRYFGALKFAENKERYRDAKHSLDGRNVRIDVNFEPSSTIDQAAADAVDSALDALAARRDAALAEIDATIGKAKSVPKELFVFYRDEVEGFAKTTETEFVTLLKVERAGLYPDDEDGRTMVIDFVVEGPQTDQLLVANFDRKGEVLHFSWES